MKKERIYMRFEGVVVSIQPVKRRKKEDLTDYEKRLGMVELLWSRSLRYTRLFAIFKETSWPSHHFKTTPGILEKDDQGQLILRTKNHIYTFQVTRVYLDHSSGY